MNWLFNGSINQKQTPAFYASSLATRPAAGYVGRLFIDTDTPSSGIYRDTGSAWVSIADPGAGTTGTLQQVTTNGNITTLGIRVGDTGVFGTISPITVGYTLESVGNFRVSGTSYCRGGTSSIADFSPLILDNGGENGSNIDFVNAFGSLGRITVTKAGTGSQADEGLFKLDLATNSVLSNVLNITNTGIINTVSRLNVNGATDNASIQLNVIGAGNFTGLLGSSGGVNSTAAVAYTATGRVASFQDALRATNTSADLLITIEGNTPGVRYTGSSAYACIVGSASNTPLEFGTNDIIRGRYTEAGAFVTLGTLGINGVENSVTNGDYTPTVVPITNLGAAGNTPFVGHWQQVGDIVTFSFTFNYANATAASQITCGLTIPTGAAFTAGTDGWGAASWSNFIVNDIGSCIVTARNGQAQIQLIWFQPALTTEGSITGVITYKKR